MSSARVCIATTAARRPEPGSTRTPPGPDRLRLCAAGSVTSELDLSFFLLNFLAVSSAWGSVGSAFQVLNCSSGLVCPRFRAQPFAQKPGQAETIWFSPRLRHVGAEDRADANKGVVGVFRQHL